MHCIVCDICNVTAHLSCAGLTALPEGFWYCVACMKIILTGGYRDLTTDLALMQYVFTGEHKQGIDDITRERVTRAANFLCRSGD